MPLEFHDTDALEIDETLSQAEQSIRRLCSDAATIDADNPHAEDLVLPTVDTSRCRSGDVLAGRIKPTECPEFGAACQPDSPLGAPMVSSEGACAAYFRYRPTPRPALNNGTP